MTADKPLLRLKNESNAGSIWKRNKNIFHFHGKELSSLGKQKIPFSPRHMSGRRSVHLLLHKEPESDGFLMLDLPACVLQAQKGGWGGGG